MLIKKCNIHSNYLKKKEKRRDIIILKMIDSSIHSYTLLKQKSRLLKPKTTSKILAHLTLIGQINLSPYHASRWALKVDGHSPTAHLRVTPKN